MANPKSTKAINSGKVLVNLDKISSSAHIVSVELTEDIRNGSVVKLGDYQGQDFYKGVKPAVLADDRIAFVAASILPYDLKVNVEDVVLKAGERVRAYVLQRGDIITLSNDAIEGATAVGKFVVPAVGSYQVAASDAKVEGLNFVVIAKERLHGLDATVLEVI